MPHRTRLQATVGGWQNANLKRQFNGTGYSYYATQSLDGRNPRWCGLNSVSLHARSPPHCNSPFVCGGFRSAVDGFMLP